MNSASSRSAGFTLLEVLVATALFGLVIVIMSGGIRFAGRAVAVEQRLLDGAGDLEPVRTVLRRMIGEAQGIEGSSNRLQFIGALPEALGDRGRFDVNLSIDGGHLAVDWRPHRRAADAATARTGHVDLVSGVAAVEFSYFARTMDGKAEWRSTVDRAASPALVRVRLQFPNDDRRRWIDLVVAPGADMPLLVPVKAQGQRD